MRGFFITGTDTEVGKTRLSVAFVDLLKAQHYQVAAMKPVASGCEQTAQGLRNDDAIQLSQAASMVLPYESVNPYAFKPAIAPHLAAQQAQIEINLSTLLNHFKQIQQQSDAVIVEGAGGWLVPINNRQTLADLALAIQLPVIMVVAIKLGCINHALLTAQAIRASGMALAGWVANDFLDAPQSNEMITSIKTRITAPCLGHVPKLATATSAAAYLQLP